MKPVAWITESCKCYSTPLKAMEDGNKKELIPVYTALRELSDEEITVIATQGRSDLTIPAHISFARAILKKASE